MISLPTDKYKGVEDGGGKKIEKPRGFDNVCAAMPRCLVET